jgi:8-oxo-dGTP pyrophosphatase MutT (NUDIX family)
VYRPVVDGFEYLIVSAKKNPGGWVLPKGHIEKYEGHKEAALREVEEETGIMATVEAYLGEISFEFANKKLTSKFYLMKALESGWNYSREGREIQWVISSKAMELLPVESKKIIALAAEKLNRINHVEAGAPIINSGIAVPIDT